MAGPAEASKRGLQVTPNAILLLLEPLLLHVELKGTRHASVKDSACGRVTGMWGDEC